MVRKCKGFTLVEIIIVVALVAIIGVVAGSLLVTIFKSYNQEKTRTAIQVSGQRITDTFKNQVRLSRSVQVSPDGKSLELTYSDASTKIFELVSDAVSPTCNGYISFDGPPISSIDSLNGVNIDYGNSYFSAVGGVAFMHLEIANACDLPDKAGYNESMVFEIEVKPRYSYSQ